VHGSSPRLARQSRQCAWAGHFLHARGEAERDAPARLWVLQSRNAWFSQLRKRFFFIGDRKDETILAKVNKQSVVTPTRTFLPLEKSVALVKPALVIIENAADVFAEEIIRSQVHAFVRGILASLCVHGATMMLLQQPSLSGIADGTGRSGSTAWTNAGPLATEL